MDNNNDQDIAVHSEVRVIDRFRLLRPLAERNFFLLWLGESVSAFGTQFNALAMTWVVLDVLKASGLALGTLMMASAIPRAVFMLFGGVLSDRLSPRRVMLVSNASRCVIVAGLAFLVFAHTREVYILEMWQLYIFSVIFGTVGAFFLPAMMTMIPRLLAKGKLEAGNALVMSTVQLSGLVGPAAAGVLIAAVGSAAALGVDSATFAVAAVTLLLMKGLSLKTALSGDGEGIQPQPVKRASALTDIKNGFRYAWGNQVIRALLPAILVLNPCAVGPLGVGIPKIVHGFTGEATSLGIVMAVVGGASLVGSLIAGSFKPRHRGKLFPVCIGVSGICIVLLGRAPNVLSISLLVGIISILNGFLNVVIISWCQRVIRADMLGRMMSLLMFASAGLAPVSFAVAGWLVDLNPTLMFAVAGVLWLLTSFYLAMNRTVRTVD